MGVDTVELDARKVLIRDTLEFGVHPEFCPGVAVLGLDAEGRCCARIPDSIDCAILCSYCRSASFPTNLFVVVECNLSTADTGEMVVGGEVRYD